MAPMRKTWFPCWLSLLSLGWLLLGMAGCDDGGTTKKPTPIGECATDLGCKDGFYCYVALGKTLGTCSQGCRKSPDSCTAACQADAACDKEFPPVCSDSHICQNPTRPCALTGCADGQYCAEDGACKTGCDGDDDCTAACQVCDLETHACHEVRTCSLDGDCGEKALCDPTGCGTCKPVECTDGVHCPDSKPFCVSNVCQECEDCPVPCNDLSDNELEHCPPNWFCNETSRCEKKCSNDQGCKSTLGANWVCCNDLNEPDLNPACQFPRCVEKCDSPALVEPAETSSSCPEGYYCTEQGHCKGGCAGPTVADADRECRSSQVCENFLCRSGCRSDEDERCDPGSYCRTEDWTCQVGCRTSLPEYIVADCQQPEGELLNPHLTCHPSTHECVPLSCETDANCPAGEVPNSFYCDLLSNTCARGCRDLASCAEGKTCDVSNRTCVQICVGDDSCPVGQICDGGAGVCVPGCRPGSLEANDDAEHASEVTLDAQGHFSTDGTRTCGADEDWYVIDLTDQVLSATIRYAVGNGDLSLELLDVDGTTVMTRAANLGQDRQTVVSPVLGGDHGYTGAYYLRVSPVGAVALTGIDYQFELSVFGLGACEADTLEGETGNDTWQTAKPLANGLHSGLSICQGSGDQGVPDDVDWFSFELEAGDEVTGTITFPDATPLRIELWAPGEFAPTLMLSGDSPEVLEGEAQPVSPRTVVLSEAFDAGTYFLKVYSAAPAKVNYSLELRVHRVNGECADDGFEGNDDRLAATVPPGNLFHAEFANLDVCAGNEDWYQVDLRLGDVMMVEVALVPGVIGDGNLDLEIYQGGHRILNASNDLPVERLLLSIDGENHWDDRYYIRVVGRDPSAQSRYTLRIHVGLNPQACVADDNEPDSERALATVITAGQFESGIATGFACADKEDWYKIQTFKHGALTARIDFIELAGPLGMDLYGEGDMPLAVGEVGVDSVVATRHQLQPGTYYLDVYSQGLPNRYSLSVDFAAEAPPCTGDAFEPNNDSGSPYPLALGRELDGSLTMQDNSATDLSICSELDEDWMQFQVFAGEHLDILAKFFHMTGGDLALELYCWPGLGQPVPDLEPVAVSDATNDDENVVWDVENDGLCAVRVYAPYGVINESGAAYSLHVRPFEPCIAVAPICTGDPAVCVAQPSICEAGYTCDLELQGCVLTQP